MKWRFTLLLTYLFAPFAMAAFAQQAPQSLLKTYTAALKAITEAKPIEKLYLQTDKPYYNAGDTLRFKAYLLNGDYLTPSERSGLLYVELDNEQGKSAKRIMVPVATSLAWGDIALDTTEVPAGNYTLRAYTNWMRNFDDDYIFSKTITIIHPANNPLLARVNFTQTANTIAAQLQFSFLDGRAFGFRDVELKVMRGKRNLSKNKLTTAPDGTLSVNFTLPEGVDPLSIQARTPANGILNIPVATNRKENTDLQFMPEGGHLIAGSETKVGFKAISEDGKGVTVKGIITDSKGMQVATFASAHAGMGNFSFTPVSGATYTAKIEGINKTYALPPVKVNGTTLSVTSVGKDSLQFNIRLTNAQGPFYLIAHARGVVCYAQTVNTASLSKLIAKSLFPTGIVRFSLLNNLREPVNERIVFVNHHDQLKISVTPHQNAYGIRDSIALAIKVTDSKGNPVEGSFSIAVTDAGQVKQDTLNSNILNNLLLTSDLKGDIEEPGYYFLPNKEAEMDNLMLTQGWVGYNWEEAFAPQPTLAYQPQSEFLVEGKVVNAFGKPIAKSHIALLSNRPMAMRDTLTDKDGRFVFRELFPVDTAIFKLQARNKNNKEFNVAIRVDEFVPPTFTKTPVIRPWYVDTDSSLLNNSKSKLAEEAALSIFRGDGNVLKEVNIKSKKTVRDSKNLNGPGEADYIIDEEELKKMPPNKTLEEMLTERFSNFHPTGEIWSFEKLRPGLKVPLPYLLGDKKIRLIFDGIPLERLYPPQELQRPNRYHNMRSVLNYFTAEDVKGIEIMENTKYINTYHGNVERGSYEFVNVSAIHYVYIEITTRTGHGPWMKVTPGTYLYKPTPFSLPKEFYSPKYTIKNKGTALGTDLRSTIYWNPNAITDKEGKATVWFYSADKAADYNVIVEGVDLEGGLGIGKQQIRVK